MKERSQSKKKPAKHRKKHMARAIALSVSNVRENLGGPFAAVVVKGGKIIAEGVNSVTATNDPTAHAEVVAIRAACRVLGSFNLTGCEIYTSCEPCPMCLGAIYWARPSRVYFGNSAEDAANHGFDDAFIYEELQRSFPDRKIEMIQLMREDALAAFVLWTAKTDKFSY
jgi:guanine deaminase